MSTICILFIVLAISATLFLIAFYILSENTKELTNDDITPLNGNMYDVNTTNGIGMKLYRGNRVYKITSFINDKFPHRVYTDYAYSGCCFFTFFYIPLFPIDCLVYNEGSPIHRGRRTSTNITCYGYAKWSFKEVLYIYFLNWGILGSIISIIGIIIELIG